MVHRKKTWLLSGLLLTALTFGQDLVIKKSVRAGKSINRLRDDIACLFEQQVYTLADISIKSSQTTKLVLKNGRLMMQQDGIFDGTTALDMERYYKKIKKINNELEQVVKKMEQFYSELQDIKS
jgi:hypothetical protein